VSLSCKLQVKTIERFRCPHCFVPLNVRYTDPVDGFTTSKQGLLLSFVDSNGEKARVVFRLSGTGSAGATIRMYLERFEQDTSKHGEAAPVALKNLAERAIGLVRLVELTGREHPSVVT
jgi:phosphoglucomutase